MSTILRLVSDFKFQNNSRACTLDVVFHKASANEERLPGPIKGKWRHDLTLVVLRDLENGRYGPQRHTLPDGYDITYRLDIKGDVLKRVTEAPRWTFDENDDTLTLNEVLQHAQVWITFHEGSRPISGQATQSVAPAAVAGVVSETSVDDNSKTLSCPASPTPSDVTLVNDSTPSSPEPATKAKVVKSSVPNETHRRRQLHPILAPYEKHPGFTNRVQVALAHAIRVWHLPSLQWPEYLRKVHGLYVSSPPKVDGRPDLLQLLRSCATTDRGLLHLSSWRSS